MNQPNIKLYIFLSGLLIVIFLVILILPLSKKQEKTDSVSSFATPTLAPYALQEDSLNQETDVTIEPAQFTGVSEETLPEDIAPFVGEKQSLRQKVPFDTGLFKIDFDYEQDKFTVILNDPKADNLKQFEEWKKNNYPNIPTDQFIFK